MLKIKVYRFRIEVSDSNTGQTTQVNIEGTDLVTINQLTDLIRKPVNFMSTTLETDFSRLVLDQTVSPKPLTIVRRNKAS